MVTYSGRVFSTPDHVSFLSVGGNTKQGLSTLQGNASNQSIAENNTKPIQHMYINASILITYSILVYYVKNKLTFTAHLCPVRPCVKCFISFTPTQSWERNNISEKA